MEHAPYRSAQQPVETLKPLKDLRKLVERDDAVLIPIGNLQEVLDVVCMQPLLVAAKGVKQRPKLRVVEHAVPVRVRPREHCACLSSNIVGLLHSIVHWLSVRDGGGQAGTLLSEDYAALPPLHPRSLRRWELLVDG